MADGGPGGGRVAGDDGRALVGQPVGPAGRCRATSACPCPGVDPSVLPPGELVHLPVPASGWHAKVLEELSRVKALVVGPGLGPVSGGQTPAGGPTAGRPLPGGEVGLLVAAAPCPRSSMPTASTP